MQSGASDEAPLVLIDSRNLKAPGCFGHAGRAHALLGNIAEARAEIARLEGLGLQEFGPVLADPRVREISRRIGFD